MTAQIHHQIYFQCSELIAILVVFVCLFLTAHNTYTACNLSFYGSIASVFVCVSVVGICLLLIDALVVVEAATEIIVIDCNQKICNVMVLVDYLVALFCLLCLVCFFIHQKTSCTTHP